MDQVFLNVLNNSFTAGWMILAVILLRMLLKKAPKWTTCLLWGFVAIRLVCPFHIESMLSLIPSASTVPDGLVYSAAPKIASGIQEADNIVNPALEKHLKPDTATTANSLQLWITVCCVIWLLGMAAMMVYALISFLLLRRKVSVSLKVLDHVYACDDVKTPFILGILRPRIYLPSGIDAVTAECVLVHERAHLQRLDHVWKPSGFFILSVYWFHPLCWAAYILLCRDIEYACDEKATKDMNKIHRADYCQALLACSTNKKKITACPVAFGETGVKGRIRSVLHYKKPAVWMIAASLAVCALTAVCFMTNPKIEEQTVVSQADADKQTGMPQASVKKQENTSSGSTGPKTNAPKAAEADLSAQDENTDIGRQTVEYLLEHAASMSREGYQEVAISYVDNAKAGWDYFSDNPWETDEQRDHLAQAALQELYTLTGCQLKECVYTTDGRSKFIFGKSADAIQRSMAFYTRDYGWVLAGDSTPYMGFVNARRVWYSDIQQLDSPYHDPDYQGHGAIPVWFLDHSGVYQGHKIKGYDVFELEDTVFTHIKLKFDGGYYIVVTDDAIESVSNITGPYAEPAEKQKDTPFNGITMPEPDNSLDLPEKPAKISDQNELRSLRKIANEFAEAYFSSDEQTIQKFLADSYEGNADVYKEDGTISILAIKGLPGMDGTTIGDGPYEVSVEYRDSNLKDTLRYLTVSFIRQNGSWKIQFYGLEG